MSPANLAALIIDDDVDRYAYSSPGWLTAYARCEYIPNLP